MEPEDAPRTGKIVIEWTRLPEPYDSFDWDVQLDPPGLSGEDVSKILAEVATHF
ncbi:MAG TPA: hypothetical protein VHY18_13460 [Solirubrobacteraceae bacterium]|nr:hypothetical protein [Solirubrobacteraceae bacterium]